MKKIDFSNGGGKIVVTWSQFVWGVWLLAMAVMTWSDVQTLKSTVKSAIYTKVEVDKMKAEADNTHAQLWTEVKLIREAQAQPQPKR